MKAQSLILLSELGMLIFVIERSHRAKESFPISTRPSHSSTSVNFFRPSNALAGIDVTWDNSFPSSVYGDLVSVVALRRAYHTPTSTAFPLNFNVLKFS